MVLGPTELQDYSVFMNTRKAIITLDMLKRLWYKGQYELLGHQDPRPDC